MKQLINVIKTLIVERPAKRAGLPKPRANLEQSQAEINARLDALAKMDEAKRIR